MTGQANEKPLVGVTACLKDIEKQDFHAVSDKYLRAVAVGADAMPVTIPALGSITDWDGLLDRLDGLLITGSPSNVEPHHYGGPAFAPEIKRDPARDSTTLPLIEKALEKGVPLLAICRGLQELNVVLGGTLHQFVHKVEGRENHLASADLPIDERFDLFHDVHIEPGGLLAGLLEKGTVPVNSIHNQGIDKPADNLIIEAVSPDGQIEAVRVAGIPGFALAVQWHPEFAVTTDPVSAAIFGGFGRVLRGQPFVQEGEQAAQ